MPGGAFYRSAEWRSLRAAILHRDGHRCATPGCTTRASHVDHILAVSRGGGALDPANLVARCARHHSQKTAMFDGGFGNPKREAREIRQTGCDVHGWPLDPNHSGRKR